MSEPLIERLDPGNAEVAELLAASDAFYLDLYPPESNHLESPDDLGQPNFIFVGCRVGERLAACGGAKIMRDDGVYAEIKRVFVLESCRGRGLSRAIMDYLERDLGRRGIDLVRLETGIRQPQALGLYARLGYVEREPFGRYRPDPLSVFMEKRLTPAD